MRWPTVVIPVFNALEDLVRCVESVERNLPEGAQVLVIDDASTDDNVPRFLERFVGSRSARWRRIHQPANRGFVATANLGLRKAPGDVVLLNSDTVVTPGWLEGLTRCLASDPVIGTATPWTNNGEIASLPTFCASNPVPPHPDEVAKVIASAGAPSYPDMVTAVGFCMAVSRRVLDAVGAFDEESFGRGYGEENDFSLRAEAAGFRNVLCDDVYVVHVGGQSFGPLGLAPDEGSMQRLLALHPDYLDRVRAFIAADPLASRREALTQALRRHGVAMG